MSPKYATNIGITYYEGIIHARGKILCFLDDDDIFIKTKLETIYKKFLKDQDLVYYRNNVKGINKIEKNIDFSYGNVKDKFAIAPKSKISGYYKFILLNYYFNSSSVCIKKYVITKFLNNLKLIKFNPDDFLAYSALISKGRILCDNVYLSKYRIHQENVTSNLSLANYNKSVESFGVIRNLIKKNGNSDMLKVFDAKKERFMLDYDIITGRKLGFRRVLSYWLNYSVHFLIHCHKFDKFFLLALFALFFRRRAKRLLYNAEFKIRGNNFEQKT